MTPGSDIDKASVVYNTAAAEQSLSGEIRNSFEIHRNDTQTVVFIPDDLPSTTNIDKQVASLTEHPTVKKSYLPIQLLECTHMGSGYR